MRAVIRPDGGILWDSKTKTMNEVSRFDDNPYCTVQYTVDYTIIMRPEASTADQNHD